MCICQLIDIRLAVSPTCTMYVWIVAFVFHPVSSQRAAGQIFSFREKSLQLASIVFHFNYSKAWSLVARLAGAFIDSLCFGPCWLAICLRVLPNFLFVSFIALAFGESKRNHRPVINFALFPFPTKCKYTGMHFRNLDGKMIFTNRLLPT